MHDALLNAWAGKILPFVVAYERDGTGLEDLKKEQARSMLAPGIRVLLGGAPLTLEEWQDAVVEACRRHAESKPVIFATDLTDATLSDDPDSSWQKYVELLRTKQMWREEAISTLASNTLQTLRALKRQTPQLDPRRGLVVGSVQSGKTANMTGLMAAAADEGFNLFIVLTGSLNKLRKQTELRLRSELTTMGGGHNWFVVPQERLPRDAGAPFETVAYDARDNSKHRAIITLLKNTTQLKKVLNWLSGRTDAASIRALVIDDEADHVSINTKDIHGDEIAVINKALRNLVFCNHRRHGHDFEGVCGLNYVGYTATPYANLLNEASDDSLYPKHFLSLLANSDEYFGVRQVFGVKTMDDFQIAESVSKRYPGLDIVRDLENGETDALKKLSDASAPIAPDRLKDAIRWFLCCTAALRLREPESRQPVSMLIHTSGMTGEHAKVADAVKGFLRDSESFSPAFEASCEVLWEGERTRFDSTAFKSQYPRYAWNDLLQNLPPFSDIKDELRRLVGGPALLESIDETAPELPQVEDSLFHPGVHVCVDNYRGVSDWARLDAKGAQNKRLVYPEPHEIGRLTTRPAYIVLGGNTLARGLTLQGLVSTYFVREAMQVDVLLQMGRWFGYRRGYELYPRIWTTPFIRGLFSRIALVEHAMHEEIPYYQQNGIKPSAVALKIRNGYLSAIKGFALTAANKMQGAVPSSFEGRDLQMVEFPLDEKVLNQNNTAISELIEKYPAPAETHLAGVRLIPDVEVEDLLAVLARFAFPGEGSAAHRLRDLKRFLEQNKTHFRQWSLLLSGPSAGRQTASMRLGSVSLPLSSRAADAATEHGTVRIGTLLSPSDLWAEVPVESHAVDQPKHVRWEARKKLGLERKGMVVIYGLERSMAGRGIPKPGCALPGDAVGLVFALPAVPEEVATVEVQLA
jgi:hypothetical protein